MDYVPRGMPSMMRYYSTCRRWAGSTLTWQEITSGAAAPRSVQVSSDRYDLYQRLTVQNRFIGLQTPYT